MTSNQVVLLALTILTWLLLMAVLRSVVGVVAPGDRDIFLGLRWILAGVLIFGAWVWISGLLLIAGGQDVLPGWVRIAALILCPASAAAAFAALYLVSKTEMRWPLVIPVGIPPLIACYLFALYLPSLHEAFRAAPPHVVVWGVVLAMSVSVWPVMSRRNAQVSADSIERDRAFADFSARENERKRAESLEKIKTITPDKHLASWLEVLAPENGVRQEAIAELKKVPRRQGDVEEGVGYGIPAILRLVPELDLQATPELCAAARTYLEKNAKELKIRNREPYPYEAQSSVDWALDAVRWLNARGCNCEEGVTALENVIGTYLDSPARKKTLAELAALKQR